MSIDKNLLKKLTLLYIEDDDIIRSELSGLLSNFFANVLVAKDGKDGFRTYLENKDKINIILTDINMPILNGIELIKRIRDFDEKIPVIFATAYSDTEFFADAIKLRAQEYIVKPIDIKHLINLLNNIAITLYKETQLRLQQLELSRYKEILNTSNIVIKLDMQLNIISVNELFCQISGFEEDELIGNEFKSLRYDDFSNDIYTSLYADVLNNKPWQGILKNITKTKSSFTTDSHVFPTHDETGEMNGAICIQRDITKELSKKREMQMALMKEKSDTFIKNKEEFVEHNNAMNDLKYRLEKAHLDLEQSIRNLDKYEYSIEKYKLENKNLKTEIALYKKNTNNNTALKLTRENSDLRLEIKKVKEKLSDLELNYEKDLAQIKVNFNSKIIEQEETITELNDKLNSTFSDDVLIQKLEYWKEKAKQEATRIENLERQIVAHVDAATMGKIFT